MSVVVLDCCFFLLVSSNDEEGSCRSSCKVMNTSPSPLYGMPENKFSEWMGGHVDSYAELFKFSYRLCLSTGLSVRIVDVTSIRMLLPYKGMWNFSADSSHCLNRVIGSIAGASV